jgi:5-aminolevulinate synthase
MFLSSSSSLKFFEACTVNPAKAKAVRATDDTVRRLRFISFIFTTTKAPAIAAGALASIRHLRASCAEREALQAKSQKLQALLAAANLPFIATKTQIVPVIVGDAAKAKEISETLLNDYGIYLQHINYPTVPKGTERLRIAPTPLHTDAMLEQLVNALQEVFAQQNIRLAS